MLRIGTSIAAVMLCAAATQAAGLLGVVRSFKLVRWL